MNRVLLKFLICLVTLLPVMAARAQADKGTNSSADRRGWPEKLVLAIPGEETFAERFNTLGQALEKQMQLKVEVRSVPGYLEIITQMKDGKVDLAYLGPYSYLAAAEAIGVKPLAKELDHSGNPGYHSIIFTRSDSQITSLEAAKGKVMAFSDRKSTSGFLMPMLYLTMTMHVVPATYFSKVEIAGDHFKVAKGVAEKTYDLGATGDMELERSLQTLGLSEKDFRILWTSEMIPGSPYCIRTGLPQSFNDALLKAMLKLNDQPEVLSKLDIGGFAAATDKDYDITRRLRSLAGMGPQVPKF